MVPRLAYLAFYFTPPWTLLCTAQWVRPNWLKTSCLWIELSFLLILPKTQDCTWLCENVKMIIPKPSQSVKMMQPHKSKYLNSKILREDTLIIKVASHAPLCVGISLCYVPLPIILPMNANCQRNPIGVNSAHFSLIFSSSNNAYTMRGSS